MKRKEKKKEMKITNSQQKLMDDVRTLRYTIYTSVSYIA